MKREDFDDTRQAKILQPIQSSELGAMTPGVDYHLNKIPAFAFDLGIVIQPPKPEVEHSEPEHHATKHKRSQAKETPENSSDT